MHPTPMWQRCCPQSKTSVPDSDLETWTQALSPTLERGCASRSESGHKLETGHKGGVFPRFQVCPDWHLETKVYVA